DRLSLDRPLLVPESLSADESIGEATMSSVDLAQFGLPRQGAPGDECDAARALRSAKLELSYGLARTTSQRRAAFALVHQAYVRAGLGEPNPLGLRVTPHQILPTSQVFVGVIKAEVVSTVSLIGDGR